MTASRHITAALLRAMPLPRLDPKRGKVARGTLFVFGGSNEVPGAAMLTALAALRAGAGTIVIGTSHARVDGVAAAIPEARVIGLPVRRGELDPRAARTFAATASGEHCDALVIGPGMARGTAGAALLRRIARDAQPPACVVDAAPLAAFAPERPRIRGVPLVLTPHAGEMGKLTGLSSDAVLARALPLARGTAERTGAVVVLKGAVTYIAAPDGRTFHNTTGNLGLGTAGSGDTLAGIIGGLCARGADPLRAAIWGVYLHGSAGDRLARRIGPIGYLARELLAEVPPLLASLAR